MTTLKEKYAKWEEYMFVDLERHIKAAYDELEKAFDNNKYDIKTLHAIDWWLYDAIKLIEDAEAYYNGPTEGN